MDKYRDKYGQLAGTESIDQTIYRCFEDLPGEEVQKLAKKLQHLGRQAKDDEAMHTFREVLIGAYLARAGHPATYERPLNGQTPDWTLMENSSPAGIIDAVTHHLARAMEEDREKTNAAGKVWVGWPDNTKRLRDKIDKKAGRYAAIAQQHQLPCVVAVFGNVDAAVHEGELVACLAGPDSAFEDRATLTGVLVVQDDGRFGYSFRYHPNPAALFPLSLPHEDWRYG